MKDKKSKKQTTKKFEGPPLSIRSTTKIFMTVKRTLRPNQKKWIEEIGLGSILDLNVDIIPSRLAYGIVDNFDTENMEIRTTNGVIKVNEEAASEIMGFKNEGIDIDAFNTDIEWNPILEGWRKQFGEKLIRQNDLAKIIMESEIVDWNFKLSFIVLFVNAIVDTMKMGTCSTNILAHLPKDLNFKNVNWCNYICDHAKHSKAGWPKKFNKNFFYTGPIAFLMV